MVEFLSLALRISIASLALGMVLSYFDITFEKTASAFGMDPSEVDIHFYDMMAWAFPAMVQGALVIVPLWCLFFLLKPKKP
ncbi:MAG: hypothetical protein AAGE61_15265 [Pseudomonadota bacterium]